MSEGCSIWGKVSKGTAEGLEAKMDLVVSKDVPAWGGRGGKGC